MRTHSAQPLCRLVIFGFLPLPQPVYADETLLLRFPALHGDKVVFTHVGDLWRGDSNGGQARRLTSHAGSELFARFSPDGSQRALVPEFGIRATTEGS